MFYSYFDSDIFSHIDVEENIKTVRVTAHTTQYRLTSLHQLHEALKCIHSRDEFELFLKIDGTNEKISDTLAPSLEVLTSFYDSMKDDDYEQEIVITITITKRNVNHCISVYFLDLFINYLNTTALSNVIKTIHSVHNGYLRFEVNKLISKSGSNTIQFVAMEGAESIDLVEVGREQKLKLISEHVNTDLKVDLLPNDFDMVHSTEFPMLEDFFNRACTLLSLMYISNVSVIHSDGTVSFKINGFKSIHCERLSVDELSDHHKLLNKIVAWGYEGGACNDKIEMIRNVLSIHTREGGGIVLSDAVWEAISSNYKIYLQKDIQSYLEVKNKITEMMIGSTSKTHALVDDIVSAVKSNLFVIITFLLTVVLVNGLKDNGVKQIFSNEYLAVVVLITIVSFGWLIGNVYISKKSYEEQSSTIKSIIELNYKNVLMDSEIAECVTPIISKNRDYLNAQIKRYLIVGSSLLITFCLCYYIGNAVFDEKTPEKQKIEHLKGIETKPDNIKITNKLQSFKSSCYTLSRNYI
nr:hypothetical protein [Moritella viscosa]SHN97563.1 Putative uncharacterized protein [Moritella viscosa]